MRHFGVQGYYKIHTYTGESLQRHYWASRNIAGIMASQNMHGSVQVWHYMAILDMSEAM